MGQTAKYGKRALFLVFALLLVACSGVQPRTGAQVSPLPFDSLLPTEAPALPPAAPTVASAMTAAPEQAAVAQSGRLLVLHTNDNWGETEPCG